MDAVKKYLFWIVLVVVVVGTLGAYFYVSGDVDTELQALRGDTSGKMQTVEKLAKDSGKIQNQSYVEAARDFQKHLQRQEDEIKKAWDGKGLLIPDLDTAPTDLLKFDTEWLSVKRTEIVNKAKTAGLTLPKDFENVQLYNSPTPDAAARKQRIRNITLIAEVIDILTTTKVSVPSVKFSGDAQEPQETRQRGAYGLDELVIVDEKEQAAREKASYEAGLRAGGASSEAGTKEAPAPLTTALQLEVKFTAAFPAVPQILQKLEASRVWFGLIRKIDTQRVAKPFADPSEFGLFPPAGKPKEEGEAKPAEVSYFNTRYDEAPVQALATVDLLSYTPETPKKK